ncbi:MAG TPA: alpha/beta fold hydrolase [Candidatus Tumulicola sp.]
MPTSWPRLERLLERDHAAVETNGRTIVRLHDGPRERVALLLHGLTATPAQFVRYADGLHARGYNVVVPRLPRHGHADRMSTSLERLRPDELLEAVAECVAVASELGSRVTIAGFSLGGLLTAWAAQRFDVERCVAIAPFLGIAWLPRALTPTLSALVLRLPNFFAWWDPIQRGRHTPEHGYPRYATHSIAYALNIASEVLRDAASSAPRAARILLVNNLSETSVNNRATRTLFDRWSERRPDAVEWETIRGLPLSHDIIEPLRPGGLSARAYQQLLHSIDPSAPQSESTTLGGR